MSAPAARYHAVADRAGRILALVPAVATRTTGGGEIGYRPLAGPRQRVAEIELTTEHAALPPAELIASFRVAVDAKSGRARLVRRERAPAPKRAR